MNPIRTLVLSAAIFVLSVSSAEADELTLTTIDESGPCGGPPACVVLDGKMVFEGTFEPFSLFGLEPEDSIGLLACDATTPNTTPNCYSEIFLDPLTPQDDVVIDAVIGSPDAGVIFDYAGEAPSATLMRYHFEATVMSPPGGNFPNTIMTVISAVPDFTISLPFDTTGGVFFTQVIDHEGNVTYWEEPSGVATLELSVPAIDLFGDGSWFVIPTGSGPGASPLDPSNFQPFANVNTRLVPEPGATLQMCAALLALVARKRRLIRQLVIAR